MVTAVAESIIEAAKANDINRVGAILAEDPGIARTPDGTAALYAAAMAGHRDLVAYLLGKDARIDFFTAAALGRSWEVRSGLASNRDLAWRFTDDGYSALQLGAMFGHEEVVGIMIRGIAEINVKTRDDTKSTALHLAARNGNVRVAQQLIAAGAEINGKDGANKTPYRVALEAGNQAMVAYLASQGGVEEVVAPKPRAAAAAPAQPAAGGAAEAVNPVTGKPVRATARAIEAINKSREKRGLPPLPVPGQGGDGAAAAASAGVAAGAEGGNPLNAGIPQFIRRVPGKPTVAVERAERAIWKSRQKRGAV